MDGGAFFDELLKLGATTDDHVDRVRHHLGSMGQLGRYALVGATAAPAIGAVTDLVAGKPVLGGSGRRMRGALAASMKGALAAGVVPVARHELDRQASLAKKQHAGE